MAKNTALVPKSKDTTPAIPRVEEDWERTLREKAKNTKSALTVGVPRITHKGGVLKIEGARVKDNKLAVVVLGMIWAKQFYENEYTEGSTDTPTCYAFGEKESGLVPHAAAPDKQSAQCDGCQHNKFYTALKGNGKRCQDKPRLLVILATDLQRNGAAEVNTAIKRAQHYQIDIPATSLRGKGAEGTCLNAYAASMAEATQHGDMSEVITEIGTEMRENGGYFIVFNNLGLVPKEAMPALVERSANVATVLAQPFPVLGDEKDEEEKKPVKGQDARPKRR